MSVSKRASARPAGGGDRHSLHDGFSVLEAIVVLAISSLALLLIFSIGSRASESGFRLGRRALAAADNQVTSDAIREVLQSIIVTPIRVGLPDDGAFVGAADHLTAEVSFRRPTACGEAGDGSAFTMKIETGPSGNYVSCQLDGGPAHELGGLGFGHAWFTYSSDGQSWSDRWPLPGEPAPGGDPMQLIREKRLFIRLTAADGGVQFIEGLSSGLQRTGARNAVAAER